MQRAGQRAKTRLAFRPCSKASGAAGVAKKLLEQVFTPPKPNRDWAGDITYIHTTSDWHYLAM
jgi:putative transposase